MRHRPVETPTFEELLARVRDLGDGHRGQILDGAIHSCEAPSAPRSHAIAEIAAMLVAGSALGDPVPRGWSFLSNVEISPRADSLLIADVAGWRIDKERLAAAATPIRLAPAWVCEVPGPESRNFTLTAKRRTYAEAGVSFLWVADAEAQVLEVFQNQRGKWLLLDTLSDQRSGTAQPFEGFRFDASELWLPSRRSSTPPPSRRRGSAG